MSGDSGPWFILIAGVNGAGKSTFAIPETFARLLDESGADAIEVINPDTRTRRIQALDPTLPLDDANRLAAEQCEQEVRARIADGRGNFAIETVLSSDKYRDIVNEALRLGWRFLLIYIALDSVEESVRRVAQRVAEGGHDVPEHKLRKRWSRSRSNLPWFWKRATGAFLFHNLSDFREPTEVARKSVIPSGTLVIAPAPLHPCVAELLPGIIGD